MAFVNAQAMYLIQVRQHGEPWKTIRKEYRIGQAKMAAKDLARRRRGNEAGPIDQCPLHAFVRVTFGGRTVFDARKNEEWR